MSDNERLDLTRDTWRMFRIIAEFVDGFEVMSEVDKAVTIFGSARTRPDNPYYAKAVECARLFAERDFAVITGGGPGIMEAGNKGAAEVEGAKSIGLNITLPMEQSGNAFQNVALDFRYFFVRKVMFVKYASGFIIFPGGFGTLDEFFESMTLIQTLKIEPFPVVCIGHEFWDPMVSWLRETVLAKHQNISPKDMDLFRVTDDPAEAVQIITHCHEEKCWLGPDQPAFSAEAGETTAEGTRSGVMPRHDRS